jgi:hypothetical protein
MKHPKTGFKAAGYKTKQQIAAEKGIHIHTLQRKLARLGISIPRGLISPEMQQQIDQALGWENNKDSNVDEKG